MWVLPTIYAARLHIKTVIIYMNIKFNLRLPWREACRNISRVLRPYGATPLRVGHVPCYKAKCICLPRVDSNSTFVIASFDKWPAPIPPSWKNLQLLDEGVDARLIAVGASVVVLAYASAAFVVWWLSKRSYRHAAR